MNLLLKEFLNEIFSINEGRLENLKSRFENKISDEDIDKLNENDPSNSKKYLEWMIIQRINGHTFQDIIPTVELFDKSSQRLKIKDIYRYKDLKDLENELKNLKPSKTKKKQEIKSEGSQRIYEDDEVLILRMDSKNACVSYGKGTKWCITMENAPYYENYSREGAIFYFLLSKIYDDQRSKIAIAVYNDNFEIYDAEDFLVDDEFIHQAYINSNKFLSLIGNDAKTVYSNERKIELKDKIVWMKNGKVHRDNGPAVEYKNGDKTKQWWIDGKLHREDGPAVEFNNGADDSWYQNDELHREDGPARVSSNGSKEWFFKGKLHREDGPAIEHANGDKEWRINGNIHREDGPAFESANGDKEWWINGKLHREDGPAIITKNGTKEWYKNGNIHRLDGPARISSDGNKSCGLMDEN